MDLPKRSFENLCEVDLWFTVFEGVKREITSLRKAVFVPKYD